MLATFPSFLSLFLSFWSVLFLSSASSFTPSSFYLSSALEFHLNIGLPELLSDFPFPPLLFSTYIIYWSPSSRFSVLTSTEIFPVCISSSVSQAEVTVLKAAETSGDGEKVCLTWTRDNKMRKGGWDQVVRGHTKRASCILDSGLKIGPREMTSLCFERIIKQPCRRWTGLDFTSRREKQGMEESMRSGHFGKHKQSSE